MIIYAVDSNPFGVSYIDWCIRWWKWLLSIPKSKSPALDQHGDLALVGQVHKNVLFLCQTIESIKPIPKRTVQIPIGTNIFMPLINWISFNDTDNQPDDGLITLAKTKIDEVASLVTTNGWQTSEARFEQIQG